MMTVYINYFILPPSDIPVDFREKNDTSAISARRQHYSFQMKCHITVTGALPCERQESSFGGL